MDNTQNPVWRVSIECSTLTSVPSRRLDDRIRELCSKALTAPDSELDAILSSLQSALHDHNARLRKLAAKKLVRAENGQPQDRRRSA